MASFAPALPLSGFFKYCLIAADDSKAIEEFEASKAGGLSDDAVRAAAETRFSSVELDRSRQAEAMAEQMKEKGMTEVDISNMLKNYGDSLGASNVEIITLCLPTKESGFRGVSLYCDGNSSFRGARFNMPNARATALASSCGFKDMAIMGDCFIGRALDDERVEWERLDFTADEVSISAEWVTFSANLNKGKNMSSWTTSGTMSAMANAQGPPAVSTTAPAPPIVEEVDASGFNFKEDGDDVELRMKLPQSVPSKNLLVLIKPQSIVIGLKSVSKTSGTEIDGVSKEFTSNGEVGAKLKGLVDIDESTWSVANERDGRWLTITLAKKGSAPWKTLFK